MATDTKKETKTKIVTKEAETFKYGVDDIADGLGIKAASARVQLRNHKIEKAGKSYGWNSKNEVEEVVKKIKAAGVKTSSSKEKAEPAKKGSTKMKVKEKAAA